MTTVQTTPEGKSIGSLMATDAAPPPPARRLSEISLWDRQRDFYRQGSASLWGSGTVPHGITCNPAIAATYARIAVDFLAAADTPMRSGGDAHDQRPLLVEFGGGSGRFAYLIVRRLRELAPDLAFTYVVTDFTAERVESWRQHPSLVPLIEAGFLDVAVADAENPAPLELLAAGRSVAPGTWHGPVVGIANYVFDSLRHDAYAIRAGELFECRVRSVEPAPAAAPGDEPAPPAVEWDLTPCRDRPAGVADILGDYCEELDDTTVLHPIGGIRALDFLHGLTSGPSCAIVADKGHATTLELCSHGAPALVPHGDGFSLMVNFDLLARHVRGRGGTAVLPEEPATSLVVGLFCDRDLGDGGHFAAGVRDALVDNGPDNAFTIRSLIGAGSPHTIETALAGLRLSRFDPLLLVELLPTLLELLPTVPDVSRADVARVLRRCRDNFFPVGENVSIDLCLGLAFSAMDRWGEAVAHLDVAVTERPDDATAAFAMAVAQRGIRELQTALDWAERAVALDPALSEARSLRAVIRSEIADGSVT